MNGGARTGGGGGPGAAGYGAGGVAAGHGVVEEQDIEAMLRGQYMKFKQPCNPFLALIVFGSPQALAIGTPVLFSLAYVAGLFPPKELQCSMQMLGCRCPGTMVGNIAACILVPSKTLAPAAAIRTRGPMEASTASCKPKVI